MTAPPSRRPAPPDHDCDPGALSLDAEYGWVCGACGVILGSGEEIVPAPPPTADARALATRREAATPTVVDTRSPIERIGDRMLTLDPSITQTPDDMAQQITYMLVRLADCELAQRDATHEVDDAQRAHRREYDAAIVRRKGQGSADVRAAEARLECADSLDRLEHAQAMLRAIRDAAHSWRSMISGYQTAAGLVRITYQQSDPYQR